MVEWFPTSISNMRSSKYILTVNLVLFILISAMLFWNYGNDKGGKLVRARNFEILPYSLNLTDASGLVDRLRAGKSVEITPINLNYMGVAFSSKSLQPCNASEHYGILIMIKSRFQNREDRMQIRQTWANPTYLSRFEIKIKHVFVIGKEIGIKGNENIVEEIEAYHDLVIGDFLDTYRNLTYKTMLGIRWAVEFCPKFQFYVSFDDDSYLSIPNLVQLFRDPYNYPRNGGQLKRFGTVLKPSEQFYTGHTFRHSLSSPVRSRKSKYYLSKEEYPLDVFPAYITGYFIGMSRETVHSFYYLSPFVKHLPMEDVYLGVMANKLRINAFDITDLVSGGMILRRKSMQSLKWLESLRDYIAIHHFGPASRRTWIWNKLHLKT